MPPSHSARAEEPDPLAALGLESPGALGSVIGDAQQGIRDVGCAPGEQIAKGTGIGGVGRLVLVVKGLEAAHKIIEQMIEGLTHETRLQRGHDLEGRLDGQTREPAFAVDFSVDQPDAVVEDARSFGRIAEQTCMQGVFVGHCLNGSIHRR